MRLRNSLLTPAVWALAMTLVASGCNSGGSGGDNVSANGSNGAGSGQGATVDPTTINVANADRCDFLDQSECLYPFPNDYFTTASSNSATGRSIDFDPQSMPANAAGVPIDPTEWNRADGFSPGQPIVTKVPGLGSPAALANTDAAPIDNIGRYQEDDQPVVVIDAQTSQRWPIWTEVDQAPDVTIINEQPALAGAKPAPQDTALIIHPARNFIGGHRYIVALRNLKDADGNTIGASPAFRVYRDNVSSDIPAIEARRADMADIFRRLQDAGIGRNNLYLAWDFTVASRQNITGRELFIRNDAFSELGDTNLSDQMVQGQSPVFNVTEVTDFAPCDPAGCQDDQSDRILRKVRGTVTVPCYLNKDGCPVGARFDLSDNRPVRIAGNTFDAPFVCNIPRAVVDSSGNVTPSRLSLYGHGLFGSPNEIDAGNVKDMSNEHNFTFCATPWIGMAREDAGNTIQILQELSAFPELVDRTEQAMVDFMYLGRAMIHPQGFATNAAFQVADGNNAMQPAIGNSNLFYDGNSQGGIFGGTLVALEPDLTRGVLGVPGMNYGGLLLPRSVDFAPFAQALYPSYPDRLQRPLVFGLLQMLWDRSDPNGYAENMTDNPLPDTPAHQVLMQVAYGDHQVTNWSAEVQARTIGARLRTPAVDPGRLNGPDPLFGIEPIESYPFAGSAIVFWDSGPVRDDGNGGTLGTPPPPKQNVPNMQGQDPHEFPRRDIDARRQKSEFLRPDGKVVNVCNNAPCYDAGYTGPQGSQGAP